MPPDCTSSSGLPGRRKPSGFSIVSAIFLLVVLAGLGAMMVTFSTVQHATSAQDVLGARAYHAARSGVEWGIYGVMRGNPALAQPAPLCPPSTVLSPGGSLAGISLTVACAASAPFTEGGRTGRIYTITSTASFGTPGQPDRVERQIRATVEYPPAE